MRWSAVSFFILAAVIAGALVAGLWALVGLREPGWLIGAAAVGVLFVSLSLFFARLFAKLLGIEQKN